MKRLGVSAGLVMSDRRDEPGGRVMDQIEAMLDADLPWYLENAATDFYSSYHNMRACYGDLAHLNDQWGSTFRIWDEVATR